MKTWEYQGAKRSKEIRCLHPLPSFILKYENKRIEKSQSYETVGIEKSQSYETVGIEKKSILWNRGNKKDYELGHNNQINFYAP